MANPNPVQRIDIPYFEGVNAMVASHVSKKQEFSHAENARSDIIGTVEKRRGTTAIGDNILVNYNLALIYFENTNVNSNGLFRVSRPSGYQGNVYYYNITTKQWTLITNNLIYQDESGNPLHVDYTIAEGNLFITNRRDKMFYVKADGTTVVKSTGSPAYSNHVYVAPYAGKINYYKDRLYVGDYNYGSVRVPNGVGFSSPPLGLISYVTDDRLITDTGEHNNEVNVTDTTYIRGDGSDQLDVYRGGVKIGSVEVTGKTQDYITITINPIVPTHPYFTILANDELWIKGTYGDAAKVFRWPDTFGGKSPSEQKTYDTFKLSGEQNGPITMLANVGDVMVYANHENIGIWNDHYAKSLDLGIGCCSSNGYVKALGTLWFIDYNGIYATTGGLPVLQSAKVEPYLRGATKSGLDNAAAGRKGFSVFFAIGDVTLYNDDGSVRRKLLNVVLERNLRQENWFVHTGIKALMFCAYDSTSEVELLAYADGNAAGYYVYEFLNKDRYADSNPSGDQMIPFRVDTNNFTLSPYFETVCYPKEIVAEATRGSSMTTYVSLDDAPFYELPGNLDKGCAIIPIDERDKHIETTPRCRQIKLSVRDYTNKPCKLTRLALNYVLTSETQDERPSQGESINA